MGVTNLMSIGWEKRFGVRFGDLGVGKDLLAVRRTGRYEGYHIRIRESTPVKSPGSERHVPAYCSINVSLTPTFSTLFSTIMSNNNENMVDGYIA